MQVCLTVGLPLDMIGGSPSPLTMAELLPGLRQQLIPNPGSKLCQIVLPGQAGNQVAWSSDVEAIGQRTSLIFWREPLGRQ